MTGILSGASISCTCMDIDGIVVKKALILACTLMLQCICTFVGEMAAVICLLCIKY